MNIIFLKEGVSTSLVPILTIIKNHPECIVGCILMPSEKYNKKSSEIEISPSSPIDWFYDKGSSDNTASDLLYCVEEGYSSGSMNAFLIVKEPNTLLQLNVLAVINSFNFNHSGGGGEAGKNLLKGLAQYNIRTYASPIGIPVYPDSTLLESLTERNEAIKARFEDVFAELAVKWLPASW